MVDKPKWLEEEEAIARGEQPEVEEEAPASDEGGEVKLSGRDFQELLKTLIHEMKKPSPEEEAKLVEEKLRRERRTQQAISIAKAEEEQRTRAQMACQHRKENGKSAVGGQLHSDGLIHPLCLRCLAEFKPIKPSPEMLTGGVNLQEWSADWKLN
jgi:hypothetical protein